MIMNATVVPIAIGKKLIALIFAAAIKDIGCPSAVDTKDPTVIDVKIRAANCAILNAK